MNISHHATPRALLVALFSLTSLIPGGLSQDDSEDTITNAGSCMEKSPFAKWEVTDFIVWGTNADETADPPVLASKGLVFDITNTATNYTTPCIITVEPAPEEPEVGTCGDIIANWDDEARNLTVSHVWQCEQENWPTPAQFTAKGWEAVEMDCEGGTENTDAGLSGLLPLFCRVPDFVINPYFIAGVAK